MLRTGKKVSQTHEKSKEVGDPPAGRSRRLSFHFAVVNLIHCRRVRRRDLSAKGRPPLSIFRMFCRLFYLRCVT
ncbi:MAG: hypothetical protein LBK82_11175 [Planctomycetaceae bacterium]|nr:hypothetical protein [Planctomycetaceae bacterium]